MKADMIDYFVGVDGGGTKTAGVLVDRAGAVLAKARTGSTNYHAVGPDLASRNLDELIQSLLAAAALDRTAVTGIGLGLSGVSTAKDCELVTSWVQRCLPATACCVENDATIGLAAATGGDLFGVVVVSGTGSIVLGFDRQGTRTRAGGWGPLIGEPGGGFAIGAAGLDAVAKAADGLGPSTALTASILSHLGVTEEREMVAWVYADYAWSRIAALAPLVVQAAQQGDSVADHILDIAAEGLASAVTAVLRQTKLADTLFPCVLIGGNLAPGLLANRFQQILQRRVPNARCLRPSVEPALGAALLIIRQVETQQ